MSNLIMIIAKSGRGKTTALRNCDPLDTYLIQVRSKLLPFPSANKYIKGTNLEVDATAMGIQTCMKRASADKKFKNLIIDDGQYIMATEFIQKAMIKGYDKFTIMAKNMWDILTLSSELRDGLNVFFLSHEEETETQRKMKTLGKLLDDKLTPEGLATIVLYGEVNISQGKRKYFFTTQSDGVTNAKSPMGMFPDEIPNDLDLISKRIDEYYKGVELKDSKLDFTIK